MLVTVNTPGGFSFSSPAGFKGSFDSLGAVLSALLPYFFWVGGLLALVMMLWAGFDLLLGGGNPEKMKAASQRILWTIAGMIVLVVAYWIIELIQIIFGVEVL